MLKWGGVRIQQGYSSRERSVAFDVNNVDLVFISSVDRVGPESNWPRSNPDLNLGLSCSLPFSSFFFFFRLITYARDSK